MSRTGRRRRSSNRVASAAVLLALLLLGALSILDWMDGSDAAPSSYLVGAIVVVTALAWGFAPPWTRGSDGSDRESSSSREVPNDTRDNA